LWLPTAARTVPLGGGGGPQSGEDQVMVCVRAGAAALVALLLMIMPANAEKRVALVVGNSGYQHSPTLTNPANDANDIAAALKSLGFEVLLGLDLDKRGFDLKVREFARALSQADTAVFFYAGHGLQVSLQNYLVPVDATIDREQDLDFEVVRLDLVLKHMELEREGKTSIVFLDACRDNPFAGNLARTMGTRSTNIGRGLAQVQTGVGTFIAYSTQPGNVAADGAGRNSPFASALKRHMADPGHNLTAIMIDVRKDVLEETKGRQVPWDHSALTKDFYFDLAFATGALPKASGSQAPAVDAEVQRRLLELENELKKKSDPQQTSNVVKLAQYKERLHQLEEANRQDQQRIFDTYRKYGGASDPKSRTAVNMEVGNISMQMAQRGQEQETLRAQIAKLEADLGLVSEQKK
jgi:hypothetical protein